MNKKKDIIVLGIETSCDDTSICILKEKGTDNPEILVHESFSQEILLEKWGGVVPEIAARNHLEKLVPLLKTSFLKADLSPKEIDIIGVTTTPGLLGPLLTGLNSAKTLSMLHHTPIVAVNHLFAHLEAIYLTDQVPYPYLGLLVSGGHGLYFLVHGKDNFEVLGGSIDDAPGEAFDKGGKLLGLTYPAGKRIDQISKIGNENFMQFPIGLKASKDAKLSFSGVKTFLRHHIEKNSYLYQGHLCDDEKIRQEFNDTVASYQKAIVDALELKLRYAYKTACQQIKIDTLPIVIGGGVACNSALREKLNSKYKELFFVKPHFCTDNGAMIANYALRNRNLAIPFPNCLELDARGRYIEKNRK